MSIIKRQKVSFIDKDTMSALPESEHQNIDIYIEDGDLVAELMTTNTDKLGNEFLEIKEVELKILN